MYCEKGDPLIQHIRREASIPCESKVRYRLISKRRRIRVYYVCGLHCGTHNTDWWTWTEWPPRKTIWERTKKMAKYEGVMGPNRDWQVLKDGKELSPQRSLNVVNHSPDGFSWGYGGSGPHQLALAIMLEEGLDPQDAIEGHHGFCGRFVAVLDIDEGWTITSEELSEKMWEPR